MLPDLDSLRCFEAAARELSFRAAAERVHLSPAAFGERIKRLEDQLSSRLFERTTRKVTLTPAGQRLFTQARRVLEEAKRCEEVVHGPEHARPFELMVGTRYELGLSWLVPAITPLLESRPERRIHLFFGDSPDLLARLRGGSIDCLVSSFRLTSSGLSYAPLHEERYVFVASPKRIKKKPLRKPEEAKGHILIDAHKDLPLFRYFLDATAPDEVWAFGGVEYMGTIGAIRSRVLEGMGVAVLPRYFVRGDLAKKKLVELMPKVTLNHDYFRLIWREDHVEAAEMQKLAEELRARPLQ
jgi:LysR family transcriptional regulator, glycine cleavage system transcriptional activator